VAEKNFDPQGGVPWEPKYPEFAVPHTPESAGVKDELDESGKEWTPAPSTSHLEGFRYFPGNTRFAQLFLNGRSEIQVRFRPKGKTPMTEYHYWPSDVHEADLWWFKLSSADSPGEVIQEMIKAQIPYRKAAIGSMG
jgi:hypothetical protein